MANYSIADLSINVNGLDNEYFSKRMKEYYKSDINDSDAVMDITFAMSATNPPKPEGKTVAKKPLRTFLQKDDGSYAYYDNIYKQDNCISYVEASTDWKKVNFGMCDIEPIGGTPTDIRSFNAIGHMMKDMVTLYDGMVFHSSSIVFNGEAVLFSANPGVGKSTHTGLWKKYYPDQTTILNDDTPIIRFFDGKAIAYGTPWSGKTDINTNISAPVKSVVFIERSETNYIKELSVQEKIFRIIPQTPRSPYKETMARNNRQIDRLIKSVPMYALGCNISKEAVDVAKNAIFK